MRYIEVEASDIALANRLAGEVLGRTLDEPGRALPGDVDRLGGRGVRQAGHQAP